MTFGMQSGPCMTTAIMHIDKSQTLALSHSLPAVQWALHLYILPVCFGMGLLQKIPALLYGMQPVGD